MNYCIVQARCGSTRLPGKVLKNICGKSVLEHIIERLQYSKLINKIIVATSTNIENNAIEKLCNKLNISCFRGSEDDVLERFKAVVKEFSIKDDDKIIRITCDCPFIDYELLDLMLSNCNFDLTTNCIERTYPDGLDIEIFKPSILWDPHFNEINFFEIEYNKSFLSNEHFKICSIKQEQDLSHLRWTLDTAEDFEFIKAVYEKLYKPGQIFLMGDILKCQN
jgi:spore coat polysaccharide biosynthesis protein SpsF